MLSIVELRGTSDEKLVEMLENTREEMFNLRFQHASARLDDLSQIKRVRREIAQLETVLNQRDLEVRAALEQALDGIEGYGGGHEQACGACIKVGQFKQFIEQLKDAIKCQTK